MCHIRKEATTNYFHVNEKSGGNTKYKEVVKREEEREGEFDRQKDR